MGFAAQFLTAISRQTKVVIDLAEQPLDQWGFPMSSSDPAKQYNEYGDEITDDVDMPTDSEQVEKAVEGVVDFIKDIFQ
jgi:hypothetical protein